MSIVSNINIPFTVGTRALRQANLAPAGLWRSFVYGAYVSNVPLYNLSSRGNTCGGSCAPAAFIHGRKNTYRQLAPVVLFLQSGNKPSRKATKFKKLKSINRVDTWNCNLCYHRLPGPFLFHAPAHAGVSKEIVETIPLLSFFFFLSNFIPFIKRRNAFSIYRPSRQMNDARKGIVKKKFSLPFFS